jgi:hypothetical protein
MDGLDNGIAAVSACPRDDSSKLSSSILFNVDDKSESKASIPGLGIYTTHHTWYPGCR